MGNRQLSQYAWLIAVTAGLAGSLLACSKEESPPASPASVSPTQVFRFAPPDGTEYVRTDRKTEEVAIVGAPVRRVDNEELRWRTRIQRQGSEYRVKQDLVYLSLARNGETLVQGEVPEGISATLVIDQQGTLKDVTGLDKTAETLKSLVAPGKETEAGNLITRDALADIVASRYKILFGDIIGRPAAPGSTWTIKNPPGSLVASRRVTVTGLEACGTASCARLQVDFQLDPNVVANAGVRMVKSSMSAAGEDPSQVNVRDADYKMSGWMLVEPATMLSHGASLTEGGTVTVADAGQQEVTIEIKGTTDLSYSYSGARAAHRPASETRAAAR